MCHSQHQMPHTFVIPLLVPLVDKSQELIASRSNVTSAHSVLKHIGVLKLFGFTVLLVIMESLAE
jgi:hypothetical protein